MLETRRGVHKHPMYAEDKPVYSWQLWACGIAWAAVALARYVLGDKGRPFGVLFSYWSVSIACLFYYIGKDAGRVQFWRYMDSNGRQAWWKYRVELSKISRWDILRRRDINPDRYGKSM
jgi:hypothetical protein